MKKTGQLTVLGIINAYHILNLAHFPLPGETVICKQYQVAVVGKGANQSVAAASSGADMAFISCVGE
ncbi:PfkB family carbohydrate kinase, partial [Erwinia amylovora]|uniref:PfkB family carbohydrate kinase n=1 Tax=Erwinia amylovora TaxID=552 RepID=UPI0038601430